MQELSLDQVEQLLEDNAEAKLYEDQLRTMMGKLYAHVFFWAAHVCPGHVQYLKPVVTTPPALNIQEPR